MRHAPTVLFLMLCAALPASADKRLDDAVRKAEAQLAKGKEADAVKILQKEASRAARDAEPHLALARLYVRIGKLDEAAAPLAKAGELAASAAAPVRARVRASQSSYALRAGTAGEALGFARQAVEADGGPESLAALARAQARLGDPAARGTAERAVGAGKAAAAAHLAQGDALRAGRLDAEAAAAYTRARDLEPGAAPALAGLALALAGQGDAARAIETARAAINADARSGEAHSALGLAFLAGDPEDRKGEAVAPAYQATSLEPKSALAQHSLGRVFESRGQLEQAGNAYAEAARLDPTWPAPRAAALRLQLGRGDAEGALAAWRALPEELRAAGEAQLLAGRLLVQKEQWAEALAALDRAAAALPGSAEVHAQRGTAAYNAGELTLAADSYGEAARREPRNLDYLSTHALYLSDDGRREEGLAAMLKATAEPKGQQPEALMRLASIYRGFRPPRVAEAVAAYEKASKLDPKNGRAALGIAESYREAQQWAKAIAAYERVSQSFPRLDGQALLGTAWCHYWSGDDTRAKFYTGLAVRAGADVAAIRQAFGRPPGNAALSIELAEGREDLRSKNAGAQARAAVRLLELGRPAVPALADALARKSTGLPVRERIVAGLAGLGPAAREALPQLERLAKGAPPDGGQATSGAASEAEREAKLAAAAQAASAKIRGAGP